MRYLVVEIDKNETADRLRAKLDEMEGMRVAGLFGVPNSWCECPRPEGYHKNEIVRGSKLGWWVHRLCRKARKGSHQLENLIKPGDRKYNKDVGYVELIQSIHIGEIPVQNIRRSESSD